MRKKKLSIEALENRHLLAADFVISEFMASNGGVLDDGNGVASDWIEVFNNGDQTGDLLGFRLTDDAGDLNKWTFTSSTLLRPGEYLVVFASGNSQPDAAGYLHTNFALAAEGEYVALVNPSGIVVSEYGPEGSDYPQQLSNISYGLGFNTTTQSVVTPGSSARYWVPTNASVDGIWTQPAFDDTNWQQGVASLGYESSGSNYANAGLLGSLLPAGTTSAYARVPFTVTDPSTHLTTLQMKYDDGFVAYLNGVPVASANAPAALAYNSVATADHPDALAMEYVNFDVSAYSHLLNEGENILAIHMLNRFSSSSDFLASVHLLATVGGPIGPTAVGMLQSPTPGAPNTNLRASDVEFSRSGGIYAAPFQLTLSTADSSEVIRYTLNGSEPTAASPIYTAPLVVSTTTQVRARAFGATGQVGGVRSVSYTRTDSVTAAFSSDLPIIVLENFGGGTPGTGDFEDAVLSLYEVNPSSGRASLSNSADLSTTIGQHRRGRSTADNPKTNLRIEIRDENGEDKNVSLLGMPSESDWILYAPYRFDRAMIRDTAFYELSRQMGQWAPRTRFVEVYANYDGDGLEGSDYMGVYVLMESIKRDSNRVDIAELSPNHNSAPEITGGYIIAFDGIDGETPPGGAWKTSRGVPTLGQSWLVHEEPEYGELTSAQVDYIRGYVQDFEDALYGSNSTDTVLGYQAYLDVDATIDYHIVRALSKEPDSLRLSTYMYKDRNGKLAFGPLWDFDRSAGADSDARASNPEGWYLPDSAYFESDWWGKLFDDPNFAQRWVDRWQELREGVLSDDNLLSVATSLASQLGEAQSRNFAAWPEVAPNGGDYADPGLSGWQAEVSHFTNWLLIRAQWIDSQVISMPLLSPPSGNVPAGQLVTFSADPGTTIYYTLDGSDPRGAGGGVAPTAILYTGPFTVSETTQVNARAFGTPLASPSSVSSSPAGEDPRKALDANANTKYLNQGGANSGIIITPQVGASIVKSFRLTTANDHSERDPASWVLYGTNDPVESLNNSTGLAENWTLIDSGSVSLPSARFTLGPVVSVNNQVAYTSYKLVFPTLKGSGAMQVADIRFYPNTNGSGAQILGSNDDVRAVHVLANSAVDVMPPWSSLARGVFSVGTPASANTLHITEMHYHPTNPTPAELILAPGASDSEEYEFIELVNVSNSTITLNGVRFTTGITFDFTTGDVVSLAPGQAVVVVKNVAAFTARYGSGILIAGVYGGNLSNSGERIVIVDSSNQTVADYTYDDSTPWPAAADGDGPSLEIINPFGNYSAASNWRISLFSGGSPGQYAILPGDYDFNGVVDPLDYTVWRQSYGSTLQLAADGNRDGVVDAADYTVWRDNQGATAAGAAFSPVLDSATAAEGPRNVSATGYEFLSTTSEFEVAVNHAIEFLYSPAMASLDTAATPSARISAGVAPATRADLLLLASDRTRHVDSSGTILASVEAHEDTPLEKAFTSFSEDDGPVGTRPSFKSLKPSMTYPL